MRRRYDLRDVATEIVRRAVGIETAHFYVVRLNNPPTQRQRLQLMASRLQRLPIAIVPVRCRTVDEWMALYAPLLQSRAISSMQWH